MDSSTSRRKGDFVASAPVSTTLAAERSFGHNTNWLRSPATRSRESFPSRSFPAVANVSKMFNSGRRVKPWTRTHPIGPTEAKSRLGRGRFRRVGPAWYGRSRHGLLARDGPLHL